MIKKNIRREISGDALGILTFFINSFFPIFSVLALLKVLPLFTAAFSVFFQLIFFAALFVIQNRWKELKKTKAWKYIAVTTFTNTILATILLFFGLQKTTAGNASLVLLMEILFSFLFLGILKKEKVTRQNIIGVIIMMIGATIIFFPKTTGINSGDFLILLCTILYPIGNYMQQKVRKEISTTTIMLLRSILGSLFLFIFAYIYSTPPTIVDLRQSALFLAANGILFFGIVNILWLEAIHRIPITKAISFSTMTPVFTMMFSYFILKEIPTIYQILGAVPIIIGAHLVIKKKELNIKINKK
ncbi:MAG: DMT family transporter [Nanoarchaeota archaeon]|nr:DMT family transporter [Nanoarchaeota archaeon]